MPTTKQTYRKTTLNRKDSKPADNCKQDKLLHVSLKKNSEKIIKDNKVSAYRQLVP